MVNGQIRKCDGLAEREKRIVLKWPWMIAIDCGGQFTIMPNELPEFFVVDYKKMVLRGIIINVPGHFQAATKFPEYWLFYDAWSR